ncbi:hypothetical protein OROHE_001720 [Orobanche hederae]
MPAESVTVGRNEVLPAANSSRPSPPPSPPQILVFPNQASKCEG